jgi:acetolactate synthase-1/2/3 large subunit
LCEDNELSVPMIYVELNDEIRSRADLILTLGSRLGETDRWGMAPHWGDPAVQQMIQVDMDDACLGRNKPADLPILADVKLFLKELYQELRKQEQ